MWIDNLWLPSDPLIKGVYQGIDKDFDLRELLGYEYWFFIVDVKRDDIPGNYLGFFATEDEEMRFYSFQTGKIYPEGKENHLFGTEQPETDYTPYLIIGVIGSIVLIGIIISLTFVIFLTISINVRLQIKNNFKI